MVRHHTPQNQLFTPGPAGLWRAAQLTEPPRQRGVRTSEHAAAAIKPKLARLLAIALEIFREVGAAGLTDEELTARMVARCSRSFHTPRPRRIELLRAGLIREAGSTRATASGGRAKVYVAAEAGT